MRIGTFNLNNLFGRFNFAGAIDAIEHGNDEVEVTYRFSDPSHFRLRTFKGRLVVEKPPDERLVVAERVLAADLDVLAVQEVENLATLERFNTELLGGHFPHVALLEGNDPRFIDVGLLSRRPLGAVTSWQNARHEAAPDQRVFGRDLLEVDILASQGGRRLLRVYVNHLKSHFVDWRLRGSSREDAIRSANERRARQAESVARIVADRTRPDSPYVVCGDFNDPPDSPWLAPLVDDEELGLVDALTEPTETRPPKAERPGEEASTTAWTYRHRDSDGVRHLLYDHLWLSPALADHGYAATIDRRTKHGGDGSDHDLAWVDLDL